MSTEAGEAETETTARAPVEPLRLTVKGVCVEADPRGFDAVRECARIGMSCTPQHDIALPGRLQ